MKKNKINTFSNDFFQYLLIFLIVIGFICCLPYLFFKCNCFIDLSNPSYGVVGNALDGVMGPFIAIAAAILTFMAFWVQFKANQQQRKDIEQERFENNFFAYMELLYKQENSCKIEGIGEGKQVFHFMFYEYKALFLLVRNYISEEEEARSLSYNLFMNGISLSSIQRILEECKGKNQEDIAINLNNDLLEKQEESQNYGNKVDYLRDYTGKKVKIFDGHRLRLIPFYRSICILIQFISTGFDETDDIKNTKKTKDPEEKEFYLNTLCAQLSEHEIALLRIMFVLGDKEHEDFITDNKSIESFFGKRLVKYTKSATMNCLDDNFIDQTKLKINNK